MVGVRRGIGERAEQFTDGGEEIRALSPVDAVAGKMDFVAHIGDGLEQQAGGAEDDVGAALGDAVGDQQQKDLVEGPIEMGGTVQGMSCKPFKEGASGGVIGLAGLARAEALGVVEAERRAGGVDQVTASAVVGIHELAAVEVVVQCAHGIVLSMDWVEGGEQPVRNGSKNGNRRETKAQRPTKKSAPWGKRGLQRGCERP